MTTPQSDASARYVFDARSSQLTVQAFAEGLAGIVDHRPRFAVRDFSGQAQFGRDKLREVSIHLSASAKSLDVMDEVTRQDRQSIERVMFEEVLETELYPDIQFESAWVSATEIGENRYSVVLEGNLTLHGMNNRQSLQAQVILNEGSFRAYGEFKLKQTDYGIKIAAVAGGTLQIKDELKFVFFIVARKGT